MPKYLIQNYTVDLSSATTRAVDLSPGTGMDLTDPSFPIAKFRAFDDVAPPPGPGAPPIDLMAAVASVSQITTVSEEARRLSASFSANWSLLSASAVYEKAQSELSKREVFYITIFVGGEGESLRDAKWKVKPDAEDILDYHDRLRQFREQWGTHFVTRVVRGLRIDIRCSREKASSQENEKFSAAVHASSLALNAQASVSDEHRRYMTDSKTDVLCSVVCGSILPEKYRYVVGYDSVVEFIRALRSGEAQITSGPVRCETQGYFSTLMHYPKCRQLFADEPTKPSPSPYGVPSGTILPWRPSLENIEIIEGRKTIIAPDGWKLCDGNGAPDLREKFIFGASSFDEVGVCSGGVNHYHLLSGPVGKAVWSANPENVNNPTGAPSDVGYFNTQVSSGGLGNLTRWHQHTHNQVAGAQTDPTNHMPPYMMLVYIIRD